MLLTINIAPLPVELMSSEVFANMSDHAPRECSSRVQCRAHLHAYCRWQEVDVQNEGAPIIS